MSSRPWANLLFPIDPSSVACRIASVLSRRKGAAVALRDKRCFASFARVLSRLLRNRCRTGDELRSLRGGGDRNRTDDLLLAKQALSQLSYTPSVLSEAQNPIAAPAVAQQPLPATNDALRRSRVVGQGGFEPPTSRLSSARSNQLSY
jgi:hypothetical protein